MRKRHLILFAFAFVTFIATSCGSNNEKSLSSISNVETSNLPTSVSFNSNTVNDNSSADEKSTSNSKSSENENWYEDIEIK